MKCLFVFDRPIIPPRGGADARALAHLDYLEDRGIQYDLFSIDRYNNYRKWDRFSLIQIKKRRVGKVFIHRVIGQQPDVLYRQLMSGLSLLTGYLPDATHPIHALPGMIRAFRRILGEEKYDFIFFNHTYVSEALARHVSLPCKSIIDTHDIYANLLKDIVAINKKRKNKNLPAGTPLAKRIRHRIYHQLSSFNFNYQQSLAQELTGLELFNHIIAISTEELALFRSQPTLKYKSTLVPMLSSQVKPSAREVSGNSDFRLLFIGSQYEPNLEAVQSLCSIVLPHLNRRIKLYIAGGVSFYENFPSLQNLVKIGVVDSLDELYNSVDAVVIPLNSGSGVSVKAVEALSYGKPVIATPKGVRGLAVQNNYDVLISENVEGFVPLISQLYEDSQLKEKLRQNAISYIEKHHSKNAVYPIMDAILDDL
jgi:glycosyltransferase involved in cell wall biosynthesis